MNEQIIKVIKANITDAEVFANSEDGKHYQALVVSKSFENLTLIKQHQLVLKSLKSEFDSDVVHALSLKTFTPEKWEKEKNQYI